MASFDYDEFQQICQDTRSSFYFLMNYIVAQIFIQDIFIPFLHWFPFTSTNIHNQDNILGIEHEQDFIQFQDGELLSLPSDWEDDD